MMNVEKYSTPELVRLLVGLGAEGPIGQAVRDELGRREITDDQAVAAEKVFPLQVQAAMCALNQLQLLRAREMVDPDTHLNPHERRVWLTALEVVANYLNGEVGFEAGIPIKLDVEFDDG